MEIQDIIIILLLVAVVIIGVANLIKKPKIQKDERLDLLNSNINNLSSTVNSSLSGMAKQNYKQNFEISENINKKLDTIRVANVQQGEDIAKKVNDAVQSLQQSNEKKLEEMRKTVDEKLNETLNQRIGSSFKTVSEQLENVYKSLGEMQKLSNGLTDNVQGLSRILTNVKSRGTWAEVQLENILNETIPSMYDKNVQTNVKYDGRVEFAVRIPNSDNDEIIYLPIDSKFPMEDYARLSSFAESGDLQGVESAKKALEARVKKRSETNQKIYSTPRHYTVCNSLFGNRGTVLRNCVVKKRSGRATPKRRYNDSRSVNNYCVAQLFGNGVQNYCNQSKSERSLESSRRCKNAVC